MGTSIPSKRGIPGVYKLENDISLVLSPQAAVNVAAVINSDVGVAYEPIDITSQTQMEVEFGTPTEKNYNRWFNITQAFQYKTQGLGATMKVVRVLGQGCKNAYLHVSPTTNDNAENASLSALIRNSKDAEAFQPTFADDDTLIIYTKFPTTKTIKVALGAYNTFSTAEVVPGIKFIDNVEFEPENQNQFYIFVLDENDIILEKHLVSMDPTEKDERTGLSLGVEVQINERSNWIVAYTKPESQAPISFTAKPLAYGVYVEPTDSDIGLAYQQFSNTDALDIHYVLGMVTDFDEVLQLTTERDDCSFRCGIDVGDILGMDENDAVAYLKNKYDNYPSTSFGSVVSQIKMIEDPYTGRKRWISMAGDMIGLRVMQNLSKDPWWSDGGYNYGIIRNAVKIGQEWSPTSQRELIKSRFNPVIAASGVGFVKIEQINFFSKNSALRDENVRELINYIFRTSKVFLKYKLHEFNDEITRYDIQTKMARFLSNVQAGRGIRKREDGSDGYVVICDSTNNTDEVINNNMLIIDITFLPARAITEIYLRVNIAANGIQLDIK